MAVMMGIGHEHLSNFYCSLNRFVRKLRENMVLAPYLIKGANSLDYVANGFVQSHEFVIKSRFYSNNTPPIILQQSVLKPL